MNTKILYLAIVACTDHGASAAPVPGTECTINVGECLDQAELLLTESGALNITLCTSVDFRDQNSITEVHWWRLADGRNLALMIADHLGGSPCIDSFLVVDGDIKTHLQTHSSSPSSISVTIDTKFSFPEAIGSPNQLWPAAAIQAATDRPRPDSK